MMQVMDEESLARYANSRHVGMPNERLDLRGLRVFLKAEKEGAFGAYVIVGFADEAGDVFLWFTDGGKAYDVGRVVDVKATVKSHDSSDGVRKTVLTRVVEMKESERKWRACAMATKGGRR